MADTVFVYTMNQLGSAGSWSRYVFPWDIADFAHLGNDMFIRHGDEVSKVVDSATVDEVVGDAQHAFESIAAPSAPAGNVEAIDLRSNLMAIGHTSSPYLTIYDRSGDTFTAAEPPTTLPAGVCYGVAISPDQQFVAVAMDTAPYIAVFKIDRYGDWNKLSNPVVLPTGVSYAVAWSDDGQYLAVAFEGTPYFHVYKLSSDTLTKLTDLPNTHAIGPSAVSVAWNGSDLAIGYTGSPYLKAYRRVGDLFSETSISGTVPANTVIGMSWSADFLACAVIGASTIYLFERTGTTITRTTITEPVVSTARDVAWSADGAVLAVSKSSQGVGNFYALFTYDGSGFTEEDLTGLTDLDDSASEIAFGGNYIGVLDSVTVEIGLIKWNGGSDIEEQEFEGIIQWPWLDVGQPGLNKVLNGFDHAGTGTASIQFGFDQSNLATFTTAYAIPADTVPGLIIPTFLTAPSVSVKITYDGGQAWLWNATNLYFKDGRITK